MAAIATRTRSLSYLADDEFNSLGDELAEQLFACVFRRAHGALSISCPLLSRLVEYRIGECASEFVRDLDYGLFESLCGIADVERAPLSEGLLQCDVCGCALIRSVGLSRCGCGCDVNLQNPLFDSKFILKQAPSFCTADNCCSRFALLASALAFGRYPERAHPPSRIACSAACISVPAKRGSVSKAALCASLNLS